jgi:hypothetical protein
MHSAYFSFACAGMCVSQRSRLRMNLAHMTKHSPFALSCTEEVRTYICVIKTAALSAEMLLLI